MKRLYQLLFSISVLFLAGCSSNSSTTSLGSKTPQVLRYNIGHDPQTLDTRKVRTLPDINVCRTFMDGLFRIDKEGIPRPALAQSYTVSDDKTVYTFSLRDAQWSNGEVITAHDFVYTWKSTLHPKFPSASAYHLYAIKNAEKVKLGHLPSSLLGVEAIDDKTLVVRLEKPTLSFVEMTAHPVYFPIHAKIDKENPKWAQQVETYISSGPFTLSNWKHDFQITGTKNEKYWDQKAVQLDMIEMFMVSEETEFSMYRANELDWAGSPVSSLPIDAFDRYQDSKEFRKLPFMGTHMLRVNTQHPLLQSQKIRKALSLALDRKAITEHVFSNTTTAAHRYLPDAFEVAGMTQLEGQEKCVDVFNEGLSELSLKKEQLPSLEIAYMAKEGNKRLAQAIQSQWSEQLGINISLRALDNNVFFSLMGSKQFDLAMGSWIADVNDPLNFLDVFRTKNVLTNNTNWENAKYKELVEKARTSCSTDEKNTLVSASESILLEESPIIPLYHLSLTSLQKPHVHDVVVTPLGLIDFKWAKVTR